MDYDTTKMPEAYDAGRGYSPEVLQKWLDLISTHVPVNTVSNILDLGCGTGRYTQALAQHFDAQTVGIDPSEKMLAAAHKKLTDSRVTYRQAPGESLPLDDASVDLVFMSMVFHHFNDPHQVARECRRVLRKGGAVCLRAGTTDDIENYAYVPFFPETRSILPTTLTSQDTLQSTFTRAGFCTEAHEIVDSPAASNWKDYAERLALRADSILIQLPDDVFKRGMTALTAHAETSDPAEVPYDPVDFFVFR